MQQSQGTECSLQADTGLACTLGSLICSTIQYAHAQQARQARTVSGVLYN